MSELELEAKMKQILDDYAPILNVTPTTNKLSNKKAHRLSKSNKKNTTTSNKRLRQGNKSTPHSVLVKL
jgi:prolyl-tRNA editing enzyme YbaK/EbsC (Cys-tRNA(Pro) deacylase)